MLSPFKQKPKTKALLASMLAAVLTISLYGPTAAHPMGNITINRYTKIAPQGSILHVTYIVDITETPT